MKNLEINGYLEKKLEFHLKFNELLNEFR